MYMNLSESGISVNGSNSELFSIMGGQLASFIFTKMNICDIIQ